MNKKREAILQFALFVYDVNAEKFNGHDLALSLLRQIGNWAEQCPLKDGKLTLQDQTLSLPLGGVYNELRRHNPEAAHDIDQERERQQSKWGDQSWKTRGMWAKILLEEIGEWAKDEMDGKEKEAYIELVQVAAVLCQMIEIVLGDVAIEEIANPPIALIRWMHKIEDEGQFYSK